MRLLNLVFLFAGAAMCAPGLAPENALEERSVVCHSISILGWV